MLESQTTRQLTKRQKMRQRPRKTRCFNTKHVSTQSSIRSKCVQQRKFCHTCSRCICMDHICSHQSDNGMRHNHLDCSKSPSCRICNRRIHKDRTCKRRSKQRADSNKELRHVTKLTFSTHLQSTHVQGLHLQAADWQNNHYTKAEMDEQYFFATVAISTGAGIA